MTLTPNQSEVQAGLGRLPIAEFTSSPSTAFAKLRETAAAFPVQSGRYRCWVISRHEDLRKALADATVEADFFKHVDAILSGSVTNSEARRSRIPRGASRSPFYQDSEAHHLIRSSLKGFLSAAKLEELAIAAGENARILLESFQPGQQIDFMKDYANIIAGKTVCSIAGIPDNTRNMLAATAWSQSMTTPDISEVERATRLLADWAVELVDIKRAEPGSDVFTALLNLHDDGKLTRDELTSTYIVLLVGGMQVAVAMGNGAFSFLTHADQLAKALAQPSLFVSSADEIIRYETNFRFIAPHVTTQPLHLDGVTIPAHELVLFCLGAANRDPDRFDDPDTFDITRVATGHLGFGYGRHRCPGEQLARTDISMALQLFFERFPETALVDPPEQAHWQAGKAQRRLESLPVVPR